LRQAPAELPPSEVEVQRVETSEQNFESSRIAAIAFGGPVPTEVPPYAPMHDDVIYLAYVDGKPVARASAAFGSHGVTLFGGSTLREARGRGAYRGRSSRHAGPTRRKRGTPLLVTQASPMSHPILARLGFEQVCEIRAQGYVRVMRVSAKADYAIRAAVELAAAGDGPVKGDAIAQAQEIPPNFLENILVDLRNAGLVQSRRGADGGYWLARPANEVSLADVIRAVDGPLANVRGVRSESLEYHGSAERLLDVWVAVRASLRNVLERVTLADVARGELPDDVARLASDPDAWQQH
jgi:Rrf2 family protein